MHDQPGSTSKLVAYADDFTAAGTLTELKVLWNILYDLGHTIRYTIKAWILPASF